MIITQSDVFSENKKISEVNSFGSEFKDEALISILCGLI